MKKTHAIRTLICVLCVMTLSLTAVSTHDFAAAGESRPINQIVNNPFLQGTARWLQAIFDKLHIPYPLAGKPNLYVWNEDQPFTLADTVQLQKTPGKEFVILNLADTQVNSDKKNIDLLKDEIKRLIDYKKPDLITLTGDQSESTFQWQPLKDMCAYIDSFGIPWAPVFGNHDGEGFLFPSRNGIADLYMSYKNCVFRKGPANFGDIYNPCVGNYVITILEGNEVVQALFMMDSNAYHFVNLFTRAGYDVIHDKQIQWYEWAVKGLNAIKGATVPSQLFFHIPLPEVEAAFKQYDTGYADMDNREFVGPLNSAAIYPNTTVTTNGVAALPTVYRKDEFGYGYKNTGFFDVIKRLGSSKFIYNGHDHTNNFSLQLDGVTFTYCVKTGDGSYKNQERTGGTFVILGADKAAPVAIEHRILTWDYN
jgi:hypothetical protein